MNKQKMKKIISLLAGGKSLRMKENKLFIMYNGLPLILFQIERFLAKNYFVQVICNSENKELIDQRRIIPNSPRISICTDLIEDCGPLGAIYTALYYAKVTSLVLAIDLPFVKTELMDKLFELSPSYDAVIPCTSQGMEPLCACYRSSCLAYIRQQLDENKYKVSSIYDKMNTRCFHEEEIKLIDPELSSFINLNTQEDVKKWIR
jgi:molybdenum cofactor guanylyltransferase